MRPRDDASAAPLKEASHKRSDPALPSAPLGNADSFSGMRTKQVE
ncbi:hypothetical protein [Okeania sp. SIO2C9]|nr:hypothetical protein [Okeania sp. SIO2C9]